MCEPIRRKPIFEIIANEGVLSGLTEAMNDLMSWTSCAHLIKPLTASRA